MEFGLNLLCAILWFGLFAVNLFSDSVANRINYGIATALISFMFFVEAFA